MDFRGRSPDQAKKMMPFVRISTKTAIAIVDISA
jgi:hypothetical protein